MRRDFTKLEDLQPGVSSKRQQPEHVGRWKVWTQRVVLDWPTPSWTWMTIREEVGGDVIDVDHGYVWPITEDDGA